MGNHDPKSNSGPVDALKELTLDINNFEIFIRTHGDSEAYLELYPDVAFAGAEPVDHWISHGLKEGRLYPGIEINNTGFSAPSTKRWQYYNWENKIIAVAAIDRLPLSILQQIIRQGEFDQAILAPGVNALQNLRSFDATDLIRRDGIDLEMITNQIEVTPSFLLLMPSLVIGGAEKYVADIVNQLSTDGYSRILIIITEQTSKECAGWDKYSILFPLKQAAILFWKDFNIDTRDSGPTKLARLIHSLRPKYLMVVNNFIGLEAVSRYGCGLSSNTHIICVFFSMGVNALGAPYGVRFPQKTSPFSSTVTDNSLMARKLQELYGEIMKDPPVVLPALVHSVDESQFLKRVSLRNQLINSTAKQVRWAWISRIEYFKGTAILVELAKLRPNEIFDVFGPLQEDIDHLGLNLPNIVIHKPLVDVRNADFSTNYGFIFTSLFEGMPNVVLEMSQHAIPMILADVGGLRDTLDDDTVTFITHETNPNETALKFSSALDSLLSKPSTEVVAMVSGSCQQVLRRHSSTAYSANVKSLMNI